MDMDDDNDQVMDDLDEDPFNAPQTAVETPDIIAPDQDTDNDGIENIMDPDDDNDVIEDDEDPAPFTPVPPVNTPAPTEIPDAPVVDESEQSDGQDYVETEPTLQQSAPRPSTRPAASEPEPAAVEGPPQNTAPLVVALPSTGSTRGVHEDSSWPGIFAALGAVLGGSGVVIRRQPNLPAPPA